jgi:hypothetical protein
MELCMAEITVVALFVAKPGDEDKLSVVLAAHATSAHIKAYRKAAAHWVEHGEIRVASKLA